tara:strand:+ start:513 stop:689 length:177 start_codon:yes stop_codon:yes gene_type:complete
MYTFEIYEDNAGHWRWRLKARNGEIVAIGGEGLASKQKAQESVELVRQNAASAEIKEL